MPESPWGKDDDENGVHLADGIMQGARGDSKRSLLVDRADGPFSGKPLNYRLRIYRIGNIRVGMKLSELQSILRTHPDARPDFLLPDGEPIPTHFHLTEVGHVAKNFIDCGGTIRRSEACVLQLWTNEDDADHRLTAGKFAKILELGQRVLPGKDLEVEVEWDCCVTSRSFPGRTRCPNSRIFANLPAVSR